MAKIVWSALLFFLAVSSAAQAELVDLSQLQSRFEQKVVEHLRLELDPYLGRDNFTLGLKTTVKVTESDFGGPGTYYPKLGISSPPTESESMRIIQFEKWVRAIEVTISYADNLENVTPAYVKSRIDHALSSYTFSKKVDVTTFTPTRVKVEEKTWWQKLPLTPAAITFTGFILGLLIVLAASLMSRAQSSLAKTLSSAPSQQALPAPPSLSDMKESKALNGNVGTNTNVPPEFYRDGLGKWHSLLKDEAGGAQAFLQRLLRSSGPGDRELLSYVLHFSDLSLLRTMFRKLSKDELRTLRENLSSHLQIQDFLAIDQILSHAIARFYVDESLDSDHVIRAVHDLNVDECIFAVEQDPRILSVFIKAFPTPHLEHILNQTSKEKFALYLSEPELESKELKKLAETARTEAIERRRESAVRSDLPLRKWLMVASHLDPEREQRFYEHAVNHLPAEDLLNFASQNIPKFMISSLPDSFIKKILNSYDVGTRAELIAAFDEPFRQRALGLFQNETRVLDILSEEIEQLQADPERQRASKLRRPATLNHFYERTRKTVTQNDENLQPVRQLIQEWLERQRGSNAQDAA